MRKADVEKLRAQIREHVDAGFDKAVSDLRQKIREKRKTN